MFSWFGKVNFVPYTKISDFARHLKDGRLMASRCTKCGETSFPPRADCGACLSGEFDLVERSGKAPTDYHAKIDGILATKRAALASADGQLKLQLESDIATLEAEPSSGSTIPGSGGIWNTRS